MYFCCGGSAGLAGCLCARWSVIGLETGDRIRLWLGSGLCCCGCAIEIRILWWFWMFLWGIGLGSATTLRTVLLYTDYNSQPYTISAYPTTISDNNNRFHSIKYTIIFILYYHYIAFYSIPSRQHIHLYFNTKRY